MKRKKILVTGAGGQLGSEVRQLTGFYPLYDFLFTGSSDLPIDDEVAVDAYIQSAKPDYCINCAAYTSVDKAEAEPQRALEVNGLAVGYLAKAMHAVGGRLIHLSTDYVFDGTAASPMKETDPVKPLGEYGASKLKGEELAMAYAPESIVIRTSWVYSSYGNNFVKTMLRLMAERDEINVVDDQVGSPTYAADLAAAILKIISFLDTAGDQEGGYGGIYHYSNDGVISWYDFAVAIRELSGSKCRVNAIPTLAYPLPAKRPAYSVLDKTRIREVFGIETINWKESLKICLLQLQQYLA